MVFDTIGKVSILIADSNLYMRKLSRSMLLNLGARQIHEAADGVAALESVRNNNPDVLLINWNLFALDGFEVVRIIRSYDFPKPDIPIVLMTDSSSVSRIVEALQIGVHEILLKPFSPLMLEQRLKSILTMPRPMVRSQGRYIPEPRAGACINGGMKYETMLDQVQGSLLARGPSR